MFLTSEFSAALPRPVPAHTVRRPLQVSAETESNHTFSFISHCSYVICTRFKHQEQTEGEELDVHQTDSVCDRGTHPCAGR